MPSRHPSYRAWSTAQQAEPARARHTKAGRAPARSRPFALEALEPRLLFSADLVGSLVSSTLADPSVPTNGESAIVEVLNIGSAKLNKPSLVAIYASLDGSLDNGDVLLGTATAPKPLASGFGTQVLVPLVMPATLAAGSYQLLTRVDASNVVNERGGESNNVSVGTRFDVVWQFGQVPGRSGNSTLSLLDGDGTLVSFSLSGPGTGTVSKDGAAWDLLITGSTGATQLSVQTSGGDGRTALDDVAVTGALAGLSAAGGELTGTLAVDGGLGSLVLARIGGGTVAADSLGLLQVSGTVDQAQLLIGTRLGSDHQPGGSGSAADTYGPGTLGGVNIGGAVSNSVLRIGQDPVNGSFDDNDDLTLGGAASSVGPVTIVGTMALNSRFVAGAFPTTVSLAGNSVPTAGDPRFVLNLDVLTLQAGLQSDTGLSTTDGLTRDPAIAGTLAATAPVLSFTARINSSTAADVSSERGADGHFVLTAAQLEVILGSPLGDGTHTVWLFATDAAGNQASASVSFVLDRTAPSPVELRLAATSDTQTLGDDVTTLALVDLVAQAEPGAALTLLQTGASGSAGADGGFVFQAVPLALGSQSLTLHATDPAGNVAQGSLVLRRAAAPVLQAVPGLVADEQTLVTFTLEADDADSGTLSYAIDGTLPDGAIFDLDSGAFSWTPGEADGAGLFSFDVIVSDNDTPSLSDRQTVTITVQEVNQAPTLDAPVALQALVGQALQFMALADDADLPLNVLRFSLVGAPEGAAIDPATGAFSWTPSPSQTGSAAFDIVVTDDGVQPLSAGVRVEVEVRGEGGLSITDVSLAEGQAGETPQAVFTVTLSIPSAQTVAVAYAVLPGTAADDPLFGEQDFTGLPYHLAGALVFAPGETSQTISVPLVGDNDYELDESFAVQLFAPTNTRLDDAVGLGLIVNDDPLPVIQAQAVVAVEGPGAQVQIRLLTNEFRGLPVTVAYTTTDGSAAAGGDYVTGSGSVDLSGGEAWITIDLVNDAVAEGDELFYIDLSDPQGATLGVSRIEVTVLDDDSPVRLSVADVQRVEGTGAPSPSDVLQFVVSLNRAAPGLVTLDFQTLDGSATGATWNGSLPLPLPTAERDYLSTSGSLSFAPGETQKLVTVYIGPDAVHEGDEDFFLQLSNIQGPVDLGQTQARGLIVDDDPRPVLVIDDLTAYEPDAGSSSALFRISLSNASSLPVGFSVATQDGSAQAGTDYTAANGSLVFAPGQTEAWFEVQLLSDGQPEGSESFELHLSNAVGATIDDPAGTATLLDLPLLLAAPASVAEGNAGTNNELLFNFTLSRPALGDVVFNWFTSNGSALSGEDFVHAAGTALIPAGQLATTVTVQTVGDDGPEPDEELFLFVSGLQGARREDGALEWVQPGTIVNDDAVAYLSIADVEITEGADGSQAMARFSVTLSGDLPVAGVAVDWVTSPGAATDDQPLRGFESDFGASYGTLVFEPGQTLAQIEVPVFGDDRYEADEDFFVTLLAPAGALLLDGSARGLIVDDEPGPVLIFGDMQEREGDGTRTLQVYLGLDTLPLEAAGLSWTTVDGTALAGEDYVAASGTIDFTEGLGLIEITVLGELVAEGDEHFVIRITDASGIQVFDDELTVALIDDDGVATFSVSDAATEEGTGPFDYRTMVFTVSRSGSAQSEQRVDVATLAGSATGIVWDGNFPPPEPAADRDYLILQDTLVFAPGQTQAQVTVYIGPDEVYEGPESFTLQLSNSSGGALLGDATGLGSIDDDEQPPSLFVSGGQMQEPADSASAEAVFTLFLSAPSALPVTVDYSTLDGSATAGIDYAAITGSLTIAPGSSFAMLPVSVFGDAVFEGIESFELLITGASGALLGTVPGRASFFISDLPTLSAAPAVANEGGSGDAHTLDFVLTLSRAIPQEVTVTVQTAGGTAWDGSDFTALIGLSVSIPAGDTQVTVSVPVLGDEQQEFDENLYLLIYDAVNAGFPDLAGSLQVEGLIQDDDPGPLLAIANVTVDEGTAGENRSAVFEVTLLGPPAAGAVTVDWTTQAGLADSHIDFVPGAGQLVFEPGTTSLQIAVEIIGDNAFENDEDFQVQLYGASGALILDDRGTATIVNDDAPVPPTIFFVAGGALEGDSGSTAIEIEVLLSDVAYQAVTVNYQIGAVGDTAAAGEDYAAAGGLSGTLVFEPFQTRASIVLDILGDTLSEADEFLVVSFSAPTNAVLGDSQTTWTIRDDDTPLLLSVGDASVLEGNLSLEALRDAASQFGDPALLFDQLIDLYGLDPQNLDQELPPYLNLLGNFGIQVSVAVVELSLNRPASETVTVDFSTANGSASGIVWDFNLALPPAAGPDVDYIVTDGRVVFEPGQQTRTVTVLLAPDTVLENDETFTLVVNALQGASLFDGTGQVTIRADEGFSVAAAETAEPSPGGMANLVFTVSLPGPTTQAVSVAYSTLDGSGLFGAQAGIDYTAVSGRLDFAPGEQFKLVEVPVLGDAPSFEGVETLRLVLSDPIGAPLVSAEALGSIIDTLGLVVSDAQVIEGDTGEVELVFGVSLSAPVAPGRTVDLQYGSDGLSAEAGIDFLGVFGDLQLTEGQQHGEVRVRVLGDTLYEGDETLVLQVGTLLDGDLFDTAEGLGTIIDDEVVLHLLPAQVVEGDDGQTLAHFTLRLNAALPQNLSFSYGTEDGSALAGEDYDPVSGVATIPAGETELSIAVPVRGDALYEGDEVFVFFIGGLSDPTVALPQALATGTVVDDDRGVWMSDAVVTESPEGYRAAVFTVYLAGAAPDEGATLRFETVDGSALAGLDYVAMSGSLEIAPGQTSLQFTVPVIGDTQIEPSESFRIRLTAEADVQVLDLGGTAVIEDSTPTFSINDAQTVESIFNTGLVFQVTLAGPTLDHAVSVAYTVVGDSASAGADFEAVSGVLTFEPGQRLQAIFVPVYDDTMIELTETFRVLLFDPQGAQILRSVGLGTLVDDELPVLVYALDNPVVTFESDGVANVSVNLTEAVGFEVRVPWSTSGLTALAGADYVEASGTLVFAPGQTEAVVQLQLINDLSDEDLVEEFFFTLGDPVNAEIFDGLVTIRIIDDDLTPVVAAEGGSVVEGDEGSVSLDFTITLSTPSDQAIRVSYATRGITADAGTDFVAVQGEVLFAPGETVKQVQVQVFGDTLVESREEVVGLDLQVLEGAADLSFVPANGHIIDDDTLPVLTVDEVAVLEGNAGVTPMVFTIRLSEASDTPITVSYSTVSTTAVPGEDFLPAQDSVTFQPGETFKQVSVLVLGDTMPEGDEQLLFRLSLLNGPALLLDETALGTILDDDGPPGASASIASFGETSLGDPAATPPPNGDPGVNWSDERAPVIEWAVRRYPTVARGLAEDWRRAFVDGALLGLA